MDINNGSDAITVKVQPFFSVKTQLAISWRQLSSGLWAATDRGSASDIYESQLSIHGTEANINDVINQIEQGRVAGTYTVTLSGFFNTTDRIFGDNVDHSGNITATVMEMGRREQVTFTTWKVSILFRATVVSFVGSSSLPTLAYGDTGVQASRGYTIEKYSAYHGAMTYIDHASDAGIFEGVFTLTQANMILLRNYIRTQRSGNFTLSNTFGIAYPFGTRTTWTYPGSVKLIEWSDEGLIGVGWRRIRLKFAEVV